MNKTLSMYDTTLRDGAQGEGISFSHPGKIRLALQLDEFGIDYIEGGFAGSNEKDMAFFRDIRQHELSHATVVAFGRTRHKHTPVRDDVFVNSLLTADTRAVAIFGKSWKLHVTDVLRASTQENLAMVADTIAFLKENGRQVFFDAEHFFDGYKDDADFAMSVLDAAARAGADMLVLCDTNGGCLPHEIRTMTEHVVGAFKVPIGIHVHNDIGCAVANSIEAVRAGAVQVQGTMNGYGERCGNANLCTIIPTLELKMGYRCVGRGKLKELRNLSVFVDDLVNLRPDSKAPFVGQSAFGHKGGSHVDGVKKNPKTFEHIPPESVGNERRVLMSELSGGSSVLLKAVELGVDRLESANNAREVLGALKQQEAQGYAFEAADASFRLLVEKVLQKRRSFFDLDGFRVIVEKRGPSQPCLSEATVKLRVCGEEELTVAEGDGPVNALDKALRQALTRFYPEIASVQLTDFRVRILDPEETTAAKTRVLIESTDGKTSWGTVGVSENIIEASWEALVDSVEYKLFMEEKKRVGKPSRRRKSSNDAPRANRIREERRHG